MLRKQKTNGRPSSLQRGVGHWKWIAPASALTAAGVTASDANTVTINLSNNFISAQQGNHLNADLTGGLALLFSRWEGAGVLALPKWKAA